MRVYRIISSVILGNAEPYSVILFTSYHFLVQSTGVLVPGPNKSSHNIATRSETGFRRRSA